MPLVIASVVLQEETLNENNFIYTSYLHQLQYNCSAYKLTINLTVSFTFFLSSTLFVIDSFTFSSRQFCEI